MFKHLLLPTDGSELSEAMLSKGIDFAKGIHATVTAVHVIPKFHVFTYRTEMLEDTMVQYAHDSQAHAEKYLKVVERAAKEAGVDCDTVSVTRSPSTSVHFAVLPLIAKSSL